MRYCGFGTRITLLSFSLFLLSTASSQKPYATITVQQTAPTCNLPGAVSNYPTTNPKYHQYPSPVQTPICSKSKCASCSVDRVLDLMLENRSYTAPTFDTSPVTPNTCSEGNVYLEMPPGGYIDSMGIPRDGVLIPNNPIGTVTTDSGVVNYTLPGHLLHPGKVTRTVKEINKGGETFVVIETTGEGTGNFGTLNNFLRFNVWFGVDDKLASAFTCEDIDVTGEYVGPISVAGYQKTWFASVFLSGDDLKARVSDGSFTGDTLDCTFSGGILRCTNPNPNPVGITGDITGAADGQSWSGTVSIVIPPGSKVDADFNFIKQPEQ